MAALFLRPRFYLFLIGCLSGFLQFLTWPLPSIWQLTWVCYLPLILALPLCRHWKDALSLGMGTGMVTTSMGFYWLSFMAVSFGGVPQFLAPLVVFLYSLVGQLQYPLFALIVYFLWNQLASRWRLPLVFYPAVYTVLDANYPKIFCDTQGAVLYPWHTFIQIVEHVGIYGLTFVIFWINVALAAALAPYVVPFVRKKLGVSLNSNGGVDGLPTQRAAMMNLVLALCVLVGGHFWGQWRIAHLDEQMQSWSRHLKVSVIQANIGDADKLASEQGSSAALGYVLATYERLSRKAVNDFHPDLVVWPETSFPYLFTHLENHAANQRGEAKDQWMADFVTSINTPLYFGGYSSEGGRDFNTAFLLKPPFELAGLYRKSILLAFGEYVPLGPFAPYVTKIFPAIGNFGRGSGPVALNFNGLKIGPVICYESIIPSYPRETVKDKGAELLLNITNDSWFGDTSEPYSHLLLTGFRSIELRRPFLRATNTGISTYFDVTGRMGPATALFKEQIYNADLRMPEDFSTLSPGLFLRWGHWFLWLCAVYLAVVVALVFLSRKTKITNIGVVGK